MRHLLLLALFLLSLTGQTLRAAGHNRNFTLVIDPGHGGHDAGAVGRYSKEKNINLAVALELGRLVKANCSDVKVIYTRDKDVFIPLDRRSNIANRNKADLFISIHTNALPKGRIAYGAETYTLGIARAEANLEVAKRENSVITYEENYQQTYEGFDPNKAESYIIFELMQDRYMKQSVELARCIQQQYVSLAGRRNKGVHQAGFLVLRKTTMPAVLTELGFISTPDEEAYLNSSAGVKAMARSLYNGFIRYRKQHDLRGLSAPILPLEKDGGAARPEQPQPVAEKETPDTAPREVEADPKAEAGEGKAEPTSTAGPIFKVQILVADRELRANDRRLKGLKGVDFYREKGMVKYTYGASADYDEIRRLQRTVKDKFPDTFIVAFEDGCRVDLAPAIRKSRQKK